MRVMNGKTVETLGREKANERDAVQVWSESRLGKNSGNRAGVEGNLAEEEQKQNSGKNGEDSSKP